MAARYPPRVEIHEDFLTCMVCFEQYKNPKILSCHHSFCEKCLVNLVDKKNRIECPMCRELCRLPTGGVTQLTASFYINSILELVERQKLGDANPECSSCQQGTRTHRCVDCGLNICDICTNAHRNIPTTKDHSILTLAEYEQARAKDPSMYCTTHTENELKFYCETCQAPFCLTCGETAHTPPEHKHRELSDAAKECTKKLEEQVAMLKKKQDVIQETAREIRDMEQQRLDQYKEQEENIRKHTAAMIATLTVNLRAEETKLLEVLKAKFDKVKDAQKAESGKLQSKEELIENTLKTVENLLRDGNDPQILSTYTETSKCLQQLVAMDTKIKGKVGVFPKFRPHTKTMEGSIGSVSSSDAYAKFGKHQKKKTYAKLKKCQEWTTRLDALSNISIKLPCVPCTVRVQDQISIPIESVQEKVINVQDMEAELLEPNGNHRRLQVEQLSEGKTGTTYRVLIKGCVVGRQLLSVKIGEHHIKGSPSCIQVQPPWRLEKTFGSQGDKPGQFSMPCGVTINKDGQIVVADRENNRIQVLHIRTGKCLKIVQCGGLSKPFKPFDIAIHNNMCYIADIKNNRVIVCDEGSKVIQCFGQTNLKYPWGIAVNPTNNNVYVVNSGLHTISVFSAHDGEFVKSFGSKGSGPGQMNYPTYIAINSLGHVIVSDWGNYRIQVFNAEGQFLFTFGSRDSQRGQSDKPAGLAVDTADNIYVSFDSGNQGVHKFDSTGTFICNVGDANCGVAVTQDVPCKVVAIKSDQNEASVKVFA